jgi:hypothetical protein
MAAFESCQLHTFWLLQLFGWPGAISFGAWHDPVYYGLCLSHSVIPFSLSLVAGLDFLQQLSYVLRSCILHVGHLEQAFPGR